MRKSLKVFRHQQVFNIADSWTTALRKTRIGQAEYEQERLKDALYDLKLGSLTILQLEALRRVMASLAATAFSNGIDEQKKWEKK